jgi:hypothetical protein
MGFFYSIYIPIVLIGIVLSVAFAVFRFIYREKYAESFLTLPEDRRERFLKHEKRITAILKLSFWPALILLIIFPLVTFLYYQEYFFVAIVFMVLFIVMILQEYHFRKWLIHYLEQKND